MDINKGINLMAEEFKQTLIKDIETCGLPICMIKSAFSEIYKELSELYNQTVRKELEAYNKSQAQEVD